MSNAERVRAEAHVKTFFLNQHAEGDPNLKPTQEDWERLPRLVKDQFTDLVLTYNAGGELLDKIIAESKKTSHSDASFGFAVKQILKQ